MHAILAQAPKWLEGPELVLFDSLALGGNPSAEGYEEEDQEDRGDQPGDQ